MDFYALIQKITEHVPDARICSNCKLMLLGLPRRHVSLNYLLKCIYEGKEQWRIRDLWKGRDKPILHMRKIFSHAPKR